MNRNKLSFKYSLDKDIFLTIDNFVLYIPSRIIITDAFMRETLQPKEKMAEATEQCLLSLFSWRITNVSLKKMFDALRGKKCEVFFSILFSSIANKRIQTLDPSFISNAMLEEVPENPSRNMVRIETLCKYIEKDIEEFLKTYFNPLSKKQKDKISKYILKKYRKITQGCTEIVCDVIYNP